MEKIIGLDLGTKTLGISISDSLGIVHGYENYVFPEFYYKKARERVLEIASKENVNKLVLGYPLHMNGEISERAKSCLRFKEDLLKDNPNLIIEMIDERLTTVEANERMIEMNLSSRRRKEIIDMMSAVVILETYINKFGGQNNDKWWWNNY